MEQIAKIPKKLRNILETLRDGQIESGLEQLVAYKDFEPQKNIALAEYHYYKNNNQDAMTYDENALPHDEQWYAGNILTEHFFAYTNTAKINGQIDRAQQFYKSFLDEKLKGDLPDHRKKMYSIQIENHLEKLKGITGLRIDPKSVEIITDPFTEDVFVEQLKKYRPKLSYDSSEGASYLLNFMFEKASTKETLHYYEQWSNDITNEDLHLYAARLFNKNNENKKAKDAIIRYVNNWKPVESIQILPMNLFAYDDISEIFNQMKIEILYMRKNG